LPHRHFVEAKVLADKLMDVLGFTVCDLAVFEELGMTCFGESDIDFPGRLGDLMRPWVVADLPIGGRQHLNSTIAKIDNES
jgi:hypothetical protein